MVIKLDEDFEFFDWQREVWSSSALVKIMRIGRRAGKSELGTRFVCEPPFSGYDSILVEPTYKMLRNVVSDCLKPLLKPLVDAKLVRIKESPQDPEIVFHESLSGIRESKILLYSGSKPDVLRGLGKYTKRVWLDEFAYAPHQSYLWNDVLGPLQLTHDIEFLVSSTPCGRDYFWELCRRGSSDDFPSYVEFHYTSRASPLITEARIEKLIEEHQWGPAEILENIEAEFSDAFASIFGDFYTAFLDYKYMEMGEARRKYLLGVDLAQEKDYTVIYVADASSRPIRMVYKRRFKKESYKVVSARMARVSRAFGSGSVFLDYTGVGRAVYDFFKDENLPLVPITITSGRESHGNHVPKIELVKNLALMVQQGELVFSNEDEDLKTEMSVLRAKVSDGKVVGYSAPSGHHDDCVMAAALLAWGARKYARTRSVPEVVPSDITKEKEPLARKVGAVSVSVQRGDNLLREVNEFMKGKR